MTKKKKKEPESLPDIVKERGKLTLDSLDDIDISGNKSAPIAELLKWRKQGLTYEEIGNLAGTSKQAAHQRLKPFKDAIENLPSFKEHRADILAVLQSMLLSSLTEEDIKSMAPASRITGAAILIDKEQQLLGKSAGSGNNVTVSMNFNIPNNPDNKQDTVIIDNEDK